jgi:hypothetical protein
LLDGTIEVGERKISLVHELMDDAPVGVDRRQSGIELYGAIKIGERALKTASLANGHAPIGVGNSLRAATRTLRDMRSLHP